MVLVDSMAHVDDPRLTSVDALLERASAVGVSTIVNAGVDPLNVPEWKLGSETHGVRVVRAYENEVLLVVASQVVVDRLLDEESNTLAELQELVGKTVKFEVEPMYTQELFDVVLY